jgi:hypothetical protein
MLFAGKGQCVRQSNWSGGFHFVEGVGHRTASQVRLLGEAEISPSFPKHSFFLLVGWARKKKKKKKKKTEKRLSFFCFVFRVAHEFTTNAFIGIFRQKTNHKCTVINHIFNNTFSNSNNVHATSEIQCCETILRITKRTQQRTLAYHHHLQCWHKARCAQVCRCACVE